MSEDAVRIVVEDADGPNLPPRLPRWVLLALFVALVGGAVAWATSIQDSPSSIVVFIATTTTAVSPLDVPTTTATAAPVTSATDSPISGGPPTSAPQVSVEFMVTLPDGQVQTQFPGWEMRSHDFDPREGATYALSDNLLFGWGGAPVRTGELRNDGFLIALDTLDGEDVGPAPIAPRSTPVSVWTGTEFIVFGGHSFDESFVDGAAYNPATGEWRTIASAPISPAAYPAAVWAGKEMVVWVSGDDSEFPAMPNPGPGQVAAYDPATDSWRTLDSPPVEVTDATLLTESGQVTLVGGPTMRDIGTIGSAERLLVVTLDVENGTWTEPIDWSSPVVEFARATLGPGDRITVLASPSIYVLEDGRWVALGPTHHCPEELAAASGGGVVYVKGLLDYTQSAGCTTNVFDGSLDDIIRILEWNAYGRTGNTYGSAFLATNDGRLVTFGPEGRLGQSVIGVYNPG